MGVIPSLYNSDDTLEEFWKTDKKIFWEDDEVIPWPVMKSTLVCDAVKLGEQIK